MGNQVWVKKPLVIAKPHEESQLAVKSALGILLLGGIHGAGNIGEVALSKAMVNLAVKFIRNIFLHAIFLLSEMCFWNVLADVLHMCAYN